MAWSIYELYITSKIYLLYSFMKITTILLWGRARTWGHGWYIHRPVNKCFLWSSLRIKNSKVTKFLKMATGFWKCFHLGDFVGSRIEVHHHLEMIHLWNALNIKHNFDINKALESHQQRMIWMSWKQIYLLSVCNDLNWW